MTLTIETKLKQKKYEMKLAHKNFKIKIKFKINMREEKIYFCIYVYTLVPFKYIKLIKRCVLNHPKSDSISIKIQIDSKIILSSHN